MAESKTSNSGSKAKASQDKGPTDAEKALADAKAEAEQIKAEGAKIVDQAKAHAQQLVDEAKATAEQIRAEASADAELTAASLNDARPFIPGRVDAATAAPVITADEAAAVFNIPVGFVHAHGLRPDGCTVVVVTTGGKKLVGTV